MCHHANCTKSKEIDFTDFKDSPTGIHITLNIFVSTSDSVSMISGASVVLFSCCP